MPEASRWDYFNPVRCLFGWGRLEDIAQFVVGDVLLVTTAGMTNRGLAGKVVKLACETRTTVFDSVQPNPDVNSAQDAVDSLASTRVDTIVALGGGSSLDFGKVLSVALDQPGVSIRDAIADASLYERASPKRLIAVPTTSGTGSEVTPFATLWDHAAKRKHSLASPLLFPQVALLDPQLTLSLPWDSTLSPGLDAFVQCFEAIWNRNATPVTSSIAERGIGLVGPALRNLKSDLGSERARSDMLEASVLSGLAISRTRTALSHSMSYPVTAHFGLPHGLACAWSLPAVMQFNLAEDDGRLDGLARRAGHSGGGEMVNWLVDVLQELEVPQAIRRYVPSLTLLHDLVPEMITPGRADNNLRSVNYASLHGIIDESRTMLGLD